MIALALALLLASPGSAAYEKANALFVAKKFDEASAAVSEALRRDPNFVPALTLKAKLAMAASHFEEAGAVLEHALKADPKAEYAQFLYGLTAYLTNDVGRALPRFRKARELNPASSRAAFYLGLSCESLGQTDEAMALYRDAVRLEKTSGGAQPETLLAGARLLSLLNRTDESEMWIREAIVADPKFRDSHFELARLLLKKGNAKEAAAEGEPALMLSGAAITDAQIHYLLIRAWGQLGQREKAAAHAATLRALEAR